MGYLLESLLKEAMIAEFEALLGNFPRETDGKA
jgi:hypothetical protein